jgi:6-phosphogluconolactonase
MNVYFGSYTQPHKFVPHANGKGITVCDFNPQSGELIFRAATNLLNPSYLALGEKGEPLFAVSENFDSEGAVHVFKRQPGGILLPINSQPSGGRATCHVCVTPGGQIYASSYLDGGISVYPFHNEEIGAREFLFRYAGVHTSACLATPVSDKLKPELQLTPHAHQVVVSPNTRWVYVCDCGLNGIWRHALVNGRVASTPPEFIPALPNSAPRHLIFHPTLPRVYVIGEANAHLLVYDWDSDSGNLSLADDLPTLPEDWRDKPAAAAIRIHPSTVTLYVSNRNHDSLTAFKLDGDGHPMFACCIPAGGERPRDFAMDPSGRWLLCANQNSNHVAIHELNPTNGLPTECAPKIFPVATPVCVLFAP